MNTQQFPEIAKAVGAQRGGKYLKRIPRPGGGYRYVYAEPKGEKHSGAQKVFNLLQHAKEAKKRGEHEEAKQAIELAHGAANEREREAHGELKRRFVARKMDEEGLRTSRAAVSRSTDKIKRKIDAVAKRVRKKGPRVGFEKKPKRRLATIHAPHPDYM